MSDSHSPPHLLSAEDRELANLAHAVQRGTLAVIAAQIGSQLISLGVLAFLYRMLGPEPFGLLGMAVPLVLLLRIFSSFGLTVATVQRAQISSTDLSAIFWWQQLLGLATTGVTAACGPLLALLYGVPELVWVVVALSGTSTMAALGAPHQALLERRLRMAPLVVARLVGQLLGGASGILAALSGLGVWALVVQQYVELAVIGGMVWIIEPWRPHRPASGGSAGDMFMFGGYWTLGSLILAMGQYVDKFLLAVYVGGTPAGLAAIGMYSQAFGLMMKPIYLVTTPITGILLPALSRAVGRDDLYQSFTLNFYRMIAIALLPCGAGLTVVAGDLMILLGGDQWSAAGPILTLLAPAILAQGFVNIVGSVFASIGRTDRLFWASLLVTGTLCMGYLVGIHVGQSIVKDAFGPALGLAASYSIIMVVFILVPYTWYSWTTAGIDPRPFLAGLTQPVAGATVMGIILIPLRHWLMTIESCPVLCRISVMLVTGVVVYTCIAGRDISWMVRRLLAEK